jgi:probable HAF family extracellular repeat protein
MTARQNRTARGGRLIKTSRGILSFAAVGTTLLLGAVAGQAATAPECEIAPAASPAGMCRIPTPLRFASASVVSGDGAVVAFSGYDSLSVQHAFLWSADAGAVDLGQLFSPEGSVTVNALNQDGTVAVGDAAIDANSMHAYRWTAGTGMVSLGTLRADQSGGSSAAHVSRDGLHVVGWAAADGTDYQRAFLWNATDGMRDLGTLRGTPDGWSLARFVSQDGSVVAGQSIHAVSSDTRVFRWTSAGGMTDIGSLRTDGLGYAYLQDMSHDGSVIVGYAGNDDNQTRAFRWAVGMTAPEDLGTLRADRSGSSFARGVSGDGTTVVGNAETDGQDARAFRWVNGVMQDLGTLNADGSGFSSAAAASLDGSVVIGASATGDDYRAFRWDATTGLMLDLGSLTSTGLGYSEAFAISDDGSVIVGASLNDDDDLRPFIWRSVMQDYQNVVASFGTLAGRTAQALARMEEATVDLAGMRCRPGAGGRCLAVSGGLAAVEGLDDRRDAILTFGQSVTGQVDVGASLAMGGPSAWNGAVAADRTTHVALWGDWAENRGSGRGAQISGALAIGQGDLRIARGEGMANVMAAAGDAALEAWSARLSLGYGIAADEWMLTPRASLIATQTRRGGYAESGSDFDATYDALSVGRTTLRVDLGAARPVGGQGKLSLVVGIERDLSAPGAVLTGQSDLPGMERFAEPVDMAQSRTRGSLRVGYVHDLGSDRSFDAAVDLAKGVLGGEVQPSVTFGYAVRF